MCGVTECEKLRVIEAGMPSYEFRGEVLLKARRKPKLGGWVIKKLAGQKLGVDPDSPRRAYIRTISKGRHRGIAKSQQAVAQAKEIAVAW